jgi:uncharacterized protein (TIGR02117 family)
LFAAFVVFYIALIVVGMFPVNRDFVETPDGIEIFVHCNPIHSDILIPIKTELYDWRTEFPAECFPIDVPYATHMAFGWGDRGFYIETPTWSDMKVSTACNAILWPSETVMHVSLCVQPSVGHDTKSVKISDEQYVKLVKYIRDSFESDSASKPKPIPGVSYGASDAFFAGSRSYHLFQTCNCWTGNALEAAGVKTGWFTPLPKTMWFYFP